MLFDTEELKNRRLTLQQEITQIDAVLQVLQGLATPVANATPAPYAPSHSAQPPDRRSFEQGFQKRILMLLSTGPASVDELAKTLARKHSDIWSTMRNAIDRSYITPVPNNPNLFALTTKGIKAVEFFRAHPTLKVYRETHNK